MSWRTVVVSNGGKLEYQLGYLVVRRDSVIKIHLSEISTLIIESTSVSLTAALINELVKRKIKIVFCDERRNPSSELIPYYGAHDSSEKIRNQIKWDSHWKDVVWTSIVCEKIRKQAQLLEYYHLEEAHKLYSYIDEIELGDTTNREGFAAKVYFNAMFGMEFTREADISINSALNYGYSIILSCFNREVVANGYLTQLGLFHDNMFNYFNLSSDLMEPFRPLVDRMVRDMEFTKFEHEEKMQMLSLLNMQVFIDGRKELVDNAMKIYCRSVFDALTCEDLSLIKNYEYEL